MFRNAQTLGYSRWSFVWFTTDEKFETLIDAHERFFDAIGGVPRTILVGRAHSHCDQSDLALWRPGSVLYRR